MLLLNIYTFRKKKKQIEIITLICMVASTAAKKAAASTYGKMLAINRWLGSWEMTHGDGGVMVENWDVLQSLPSDLQIWSIPMMA